MVLKTSPGFAPGLPASIGQIQEAAGTPPNGKIDVFPIPVPTSGNPGGSFFDVFFDILVDYNSDGVLDVLRSSYGTSPAGIRMENCTPLTQLPPIPGDVYCGVEFVDQNHDPISGPLQLRTVDTNGIIDGLVATMDDPSAETHKIPEPATLAIFGSGLGLLAAFRRRKTA